MLIAGKVVKVWMRTFVTRICNDSSSKVRPWVRGFTLIEILVVLFIVSVMTGIVVSSIPTLVVTDTFDTEMRRLKALMTLAHPMTLADGL